MIPLPEREKKSGQKAFRRMNFSQKVEFILTYYKLPIFTALIAAAVLISAAVRFFTRKETVLYAAFANVAVGETLDEYLTDSYLLGTDRDPKKYEIIVYRDLYLADDPSAEDHQYAYASKLKVLGAIEAKQLDVVLMNRDAYDQMSASGFLLELDDLLTQDSRLHASIEPFLCENTVILEDNAVAYNLGKDEVYKAVTDTLCNAVDISSLGAMKSAGFNDTVYFGIIANTTHTEECLRWLAYLCDTAD